MKRKWMKLTVIVICMLAAGICYSCSQGQEIEIDSGKAEAAESSPAESMTPKEKEEAPVYHYVHICGEVRSPGVYRMEDESRIFQVVEKAGGFTENAAVWYLNLAEVVQDGMKLVVPSVKELKEGEQYGQSAAPGESWDKAGSTSKINLNTATKEQLMTLKGIGEAKAEDIIRYREERGPFQAIEDIMKISGIKDAAFQKIKDDITV